MLQPGVGEYIYLPIVELLLGQYEYVMFHYTYMYWFFM